MAMESKILQVEQFDNNVMVSFEDGRTALYSVAFLQANINAADRIWDIEDECLDS